MASPMPIAVAGKNPGEIFIPMLNRTFQQVELREDDVFDTVQQAAGAIAADSRLQLFQEVTNKNEQHTSLSQVRKISAGDECAIFRVGVHVRNALGNVEATIADMKKIVENGVLSLKFNRRLITEGPLLKYQSGYGMTGSLTGGDTAAAAAPYGVLSIGVPSAAAAPTLFVPQQLRDNDDLNGEILFPNAAWVNGYAVPTLDGRNLISVFLHAIIKSPLGK